MNNTPDPKAPVITWLAREETDYVLELSRDDIADTFAELEYTDPDDNALKLISRERILKMTDDQINVFVHSLWDMTENRNWTWDQTSNISMAFESLQESLYHRGEIAGSVTSFHAITPDGKTEFVPTMMGELEMYGKLTDDITDLLDHLEDIASDEAPPAELVTSLREQIAKLNNWRND